MVNRIDFSLAQDLFVKTGSVRHAGQIRLDIQNFGNLLNSDWGVGTRLVNNQILTNPAWQTRAARSLTAWRCSVATPSPMLGRIPRALATCTS